MNSQVRFTETPDGWLDTQTGLEWSKTLGEASWDNAGSLILDGWRLPTIAELVPIVEWSIYGPATELPDTQSNYYWSSTTHADTPHLAWTVSFSYGSVLSDHKNFNFYVRGVRGGS